jgi:hypothetical protein
MYYHGEFLRMHSLLIWGAVSVCSGLLPAAHALSLCILQVPQIPTFGRSID